MIEKLQNLVRPSFPKAIACVAILCAGILIKYRSPEKILVKAQKPMVRKAAAPAIVVPPVAVPPAQITEAPKPAPVIKKRSVAAKKAAKRRKRVAKMKAAAAPIVVVVAKAETLPVVVDALPEATAEESTAVNVVSPLEEITTTALAEAPQIEEGHGLELSSLETKLERTPGLVIGEIRQSEFTELKESLAQQTSEMSSLEAIEALPETKLPAEPTVAEPAKTPETHPEPELVMPSRPTLARGPAEDKLPEPELVVPVAMKAPEMAPKVAAVVHTETATDAEPTLVQPTVEPEPVEVAEVAVEDEAPAPAPKALDPKLNTLFATMGSVGGVTTQAPAPAPAAKPTTQVSTKPMVNPVPEQAVAETDKNVLVVPDKPRDPSRPIAQRARVVPPPPKPEPKPEPTRDDRHPLDQRIYGRLEIENRAAAKLERKNAHIELSLQRVNGDGQDRIPVDYEWPAEEFTIEPQGLLGTYSLIATIFTADHSHEAGQIVYPELLSQANQRAKVRFRITESAVADVFSSSSPRVSTTKGVTFSSLLFEVNSDSHLKTKSIPRGSVSVAGFPEWGHGKVGTDGALRMKLPSHSEIVAYVSAAGYYPTYQVIPTFARDVHSHIYLVSSPKKDSIDPMDALIRAFTGHAQNPLAGIVMGRVFDPITREPVSGVPAAITSPEYASQMFPVTTESGFYGFANVAAPSMRAILRPEGGRVAIVSAIPGSAQYVDIGRSGKRAFTGRLNDAFGRDEMPLVGAQVRLLGDKASEVFTDETGRFRIEAIDLGPGLLTLEVRADGYPVTWFNLGWNVAERDRETSLRMFPEQWVDTSKEANHIPKYDRTVPQGTLVGGVHKSFFRGKENCLGVQLLSVVGTPISTNNGPFPFGGKTSASQAPFCLTPESPGFAYFNLPDGEYILKYLTSKNRLVKTHVVRVGTTGITVTVN